MPPSRLRRLRRTGWLVAAAAIAGWVGFELFAWPEVDVLASSNPTETAFTRRCSHGPVTLEWVPYRDIADSLKHAVLVAEDINFFSHRGFELEEVENAIRTAIRQRRPPRGASTLTQQLAKNLWLSPARSPRRKVREVLLTRQLEATLSKHRILELYLNVVDFGGGAFGCGPASRRFFGKRAANLDRRESAMLAAALPRPASWSPKVSDVAYLAAVERVESRIRRSGWLQELL